MITLPNGLEMGKYGVNKVVDTIRAKTDLDKHITPHGLRHTHAIMLLESGVDIKSVSKRLGHSNERIYGQCLYPFYAELENQLIDHLETYLTY
jgi:site-specific recombinase XerD